MENLLKALINAQNEFPAVPFDATNPYYKSRYATLGSLIETVKPTLKKYGLGFTQLVIGCGGEVGLTTILFHESGEQIESTIMLAVPGGNNLAQEAGKTITYLRRYMLGSILGIYSDEDNDGNSPVPQKQTKKVVDPEQPKKDDGGILVDTAILLESDAKIGPTEFWVFAKELNVEATAPTDGDWRTALRALYDNEIAK